MDQPQNSANADNVKPLSDVPADPGGDAAPPLTPTAWLANNAIYFVVIGAAVGLTWFNLGLVGVLAVAKVVFGLGFVIFIHELGHFVAAKWCDVHVQTFSIGFGPALPGCSFQRGETTYKLAVLPLGGYVNMVGEGFETDEDENYPRSFKNKSVGQRMVIISAGVVMNVLLGCVLFIIVYYYHGVMESPGVVGSVDAAGVMWQKGIPSGALVTNLDGIANPTFKNLQRKVILSGKGEELPFTFKFFGPNGEPKGERTVNLLPRLDSNDQNPVVGVGRTPELRLQPKPEEDLGILPVVKDSPAVAARPIPVEKDELIVAATDPEHPERITEIAHDLKKGSFDYRELSRRVLALKEQKMTVRVLPKGASEKTTPSEREVPLEGFQFNDTIIGCTEVQDVLPEMYTPFHVSELPRDARHESGAKRDPFVFHNRLRQLVEFPLVIQVRRGDPNNTSMRERSAIGPVVNLFVPPAFHHTFGMRMKMGKVAAIREDSPASQAGVRKGDELIKVVMTDERDKEMRVWSELDPERLPSELTREAIKHPGRKNVILTLRREPSDEDRSPKDITCKPVEWDDRWNNDEESALGSGSPLPIPQLGVAYWVLSQIVEVKPGSPAEKAGLKKDDTLKEFSVWRLSPITKKLDWHEWAPLESKRDGTVIFDRWAFPFDLLQGVDYKTMKFRVKRPDEEVKNEFSLTAEEDRTWPLVDRGLRLQDDYKLQKADSLGQALVMGARETKDMIVLMYLQIRSLATGRVSFKGAGGPIAMGVQGFFFARSGNYELLIFLAFISINLAVVNFLPIPILDGGHMVFLIYEKLRGRPPAEKVRVIATYVGLATIGLLMLFVFYQDIQNYVLKWFR